MEYRRTTASRFLNWLMKNEDNIFLLYLVALAIFSGVMLIKRIDATPLPHETAAVRFEDLPPLTGEDFN